MANLNKQERLDVFNSYPETIRTVFKNSQNELYDDTKAWQLLLKMNLLAFGNVTKPAIVT